MAKLKDLLQQRFLKKEPQKMIQLAERSGEGTLSAFSGLFQVSELGEKERQELSDILEKHRDESHDISHDLRQLIGLTCEVKAIQSQAALLHGERIKKAQTLLKRYKEGAFTAWLLATYGNRQTPYNFLQYYEFHKEIPQTLHPMMETMPRQAIYTLASREGAFEKKQEIVKNYSGETKEQLLTLIRTAFPLPEKDQRAENIGFTTIKELKKLLSHYERPYRPLSERQRKEIVSLLKELEKKVF
jgi:uncharacterized protein (DUF433 family)